MSPLPPKPHSKNSLEQQQQRHIYVRHTPLSVSIVFMVLAVVSIPLGVVVIKSGDQTTKLDFRYDHYNNYKHSIAPAGELAVDFPFNGTVLSTGIKTRLDFSLSSSLTAPVYMQYRLHPFYQNHRLFASSIDYEQLRGGTSDLIPLCQPFRFPGEATGDTVSGYYSPCGAFPWSMFNDSISLFKNDGTLICDGGAFTVDGSSRVAGNNCKKTGIALARDVKSRFKAPGVIPGHGPMWKADGDPSATDPFLKEGYYFKEPGHKIPSSLDEDLMVWSNMAFTSNVVKDYRIITVDLPAGDYFFEITEHFPTSAYSSRKYVQLSTRSWIGGRSHLLGIALILLGSVAFTLGVALLSLQCILTPA
ncbi:hypothetical protein JKF63_02412 [Porcisia hertigi]|uniref:ALA-interacting subunit n=1 Tax=Porcisia hertigi TaxID=2761500 RepID=A0A836HN14_9TRYP|nr:hypothetical protein JKF63_02412 [Porcisia hertigi]